MMWKIRWYYCFWLSFRDFRSSSNFATPGNIPFHTVIKISGGWNETVRVEDRGGAIKGKRLDIFVELIKKQINLESNIIVQ